MRQNATLASCFSIALSSFAARHTQVEKLAFIHKDKAD